MPTSSKYHEGLDNTVNLVIVKEQIAAASVASGRTPDAVSLVAVSKTFESTKIEPILAAGQQVFGENRVQEAAAKWPQLKAMYPETRLHLIGSLQSNKVVDAMTLFDVIETVDRPKVARAIVRARDRLGSCPELLIQINTGEEPQKAGVWPSEADAFIGQCQRDFALPICGLMCIPPAAGEPSLHFGLLREIARRHELASLSMGMSSDYEIAIAYGATHVRLGTAIFGQRDI